MGIFEDATRNKWRFPFNGQISVEDLWDLNLAQLDSVYQSLNKQMESMQGSSLMEKANKKRNKDVDTLADKMELVRYIFNIKNDESETARKAAETRRRNNRIASIIADKEDAALRDMSVEELKKMLDGGEIASKPDTF